MGRKRQSGVVFLLITIVAIFSGCTKEPPSPQEILMQGATAWNQWREENPEAKPDLSGLVLENAALASVRLEQFRLSGAQFRGADLTGAQLNGADLSGADLRGANFTSADLTSANLEGAQLGGAILVETQLAGASLVRADVGQADLRSADLSNATIDAMKNWETVKSFQDTNIYRVVLAPGGFKEHSLANGAKKES